MAVLISFLTAQPELSGVPVSADLIGHVTGDLRVVVELAGGSRVVRDKADRWELALNYYGPSKRDVAALAFMVREVLLERLPGTRTSSCVVADVREGMAPFDITDPATAEQRWGHLVSMTIYN